MVVRLWVETSVWYSSHINSSLPKAIFGVLRSKSIEFLVLLLMATHELPFEIFYGGAHGVCVEVVESIYMRILLLIGAFVDQKSSPSKVENSLRFLINHQQGFVYFVEYLSTMFATENALFLKDVELYKYAIQKKVLQHDKATNAGPAAKHAVDADSLVETLVMMM